MRSMASKQPNHQSSQTYLTAGVFEALLFFGPMSTLWQNATVGGARLEFKLSGLRLKGLERGSVPSQPFFSPMPGLPQTIDDINQEVQDYDGNGDDLPRQPGPKKAQVSYKAAV